MQLTFVAKNRSDDENGKRMDVLLLHTRPNKVKNNMFLVLLPGHFCQAVKHFLLTVQNNFVDSFT